MAKKRKKQRKGKKAEKRPSKKKSKRVESKKSGQGKGKQKAGKRKTRKEKSKKKKQKGKEEGLGKEERIEILKDFTKKALDEYGPAIRSIVLFGSTARQEFKMDSDIDVFLILDDTRKKISPKKKDEMTRKLDKIAKESNKQLSIQKPYLLTDFWRLVREGHPIIFNFIREGVPVYDRDIFLPIKKLLQRGEIKPSREAVEKFMSRGPKRLKRVENAKVYMVVEDCYYAMLESAQAVLMFLGKSPPRPSDAPKEMRRSLVEKDFLKEKYPKYLEDVIQLRKKVEHKKKKSISGEKLDQWIKKTKEFVKQMQKLIVKVEIVKRENMVMKSHSIMSETINTLLKTLDKEPGEDLAENLKKDLVKKGLVKKNYLDVYQRLGEMKEMVKEGELMEIPKREILMHREYVRKFIQEAGKVMRKMKGKEGK